MCGITGIATVSGTPSRALLSAMCGEIRHRGPDGEGVFVADGIGLGMRRLAVIDIAGGEQPMSAAGGRVQVVFNGEIYNYRELRKELESLGHVFRTHSDTEVIPLLYLQYGRAFLERLNGMFAIALWDEREQSLLLARDRVGIKPLLYAVFPDRLTFGSELKPILVAEHRLGELNLSGLDQLLTYEYTASPDTLLENVYKLPPGSWLSWRRGRVSTGTFWQVPEHCEPNTASVEVQAEELEATLTAAVERQMVSDVPLGAFLSGGIDSSILVSAMSRLGAEPPATFSVGFADSSYDELQYARALARHCGTEHHEQVLEADFRDHLATVVSHLDQPIADFSVFPTLLVSGVARERVTVALSGDGGDELFGGYDTYLADRVSRRALDWLPRPLRGAAARLARTVPLAPEKRGIGNTLRVFLDGAERPGHWQHIRWMMYLGDQRRSGLYSDGFAAAVRGSDERLIERFLPRNAGGRLNDQSRCDLRWYLPENILPKVDLMSMAVSLEARVPYLDNEVIDLALRMPGNLKIRNGVRKFVLKRAFQGQLPGVILDRGKEGFSIPMKNWLRGEWRDLMHELLEDTSLETTGLFRPTGIRALMDEHERGAENHSHLLWSLMVFQLWRQRFFSDVSAGRRDVAGGPV